MFESLFDLPLAIAGRVTILILCAYAIGGLLLVRQPWRAKLRGVVHGQPAVTNNLQSSARSPF